MSTTITGYAICDTKDDRLPWLVANALQGFVLGEPEASSPEPRIRVAARGVRSDYAWQSDMHRFVFRCGGRTRVISLHTRCDGDLRELGPRGVVVSMGSDADGERIVSSVLDVLSLLGPTHVEDDLSSDGRRAYDRRPTVVDLAAARVFGAFEIARLVEMDDEGVLDPTRSFEAKFGATREEMLDWDRRLRSSFGSTDASSDSRAVSKAFEAFCLERVQPLEADYQTAAPRI